MGRRRTAPGPLRIRGIAEVALTVGDLTIAESFYRDVLGLPVVARAPSGRSVSLLVGEAVVVLVVEATEATDDGSRPAHVAFNLDARDLDRAVKHLAACRIAVRGPVIHTSGSRSAYFTDPDGHEIELYAPSL